MGPVHDTIKTQDAIYSSTDSGRLAFVAAQDVAQAAFDALTADKSPDTDYILVGPELWSYDEVDLNAEFVDLILTTLQVADYFSTLLGRTIKHRNLTPAEFKQHFVSTGMPDEYADLMVRLDRLVAQGSEEKAFNIDKDRKRVGKISLRQFLGDRKDTWAN
jgi:festuclavine dehydrogenase